MGWLGTCSSEKDYGVRARQNQRKVVRYLDERSHVSKNVCEIHLVMALMPAGRQGSVSLSGHVVGASDVRLFRTTIAFFLPAQDVLDVRGLEQPFIDSGLSLCEGTKDHSVEFVRELRKA